MSRTETPLPHGYTYLFGLEASVSRAVETWPLLDELLGLDSWQRPISAFLDPEFYSRGQEAQRAVRNQLVRESEHLSEVESARRRSHVSAIASMLTEMIARENTRGLGVKTPEGVKPLCQSGGDCEVVDVLFPVEDEFYRLLEAGPALLTQRYAITQVAYVWEARNKRLPCFQGNKWRVQPRDILFDVFNNQNGGLPIWENVRDFADCLLVMKTSSVPDKHDIHRLLDAHAGLLAALTAEHLPVLAKECARFIDGAMLKQQRLIKAVKRTDVADHFGVGTRSRSFDKVWKAALAMLDDDVSALLSRPGRRRPEGNRQL